MKDKKRIDVLLTERGVFKSRSQASSYILARKVFINDKIVDKPGRIYTLDDDDKIEIKEQYKYVSRGGYKLEKALKEFDIAVDGKVCLDIGASTGGFTDCLLQNDALKVYAVDVGYGQFDFKLKQDKRVVLYEKTNIRYIDKSFLQEKIDIVTIDVSFISVKKFLETVIEFLNPDFDIIVLIKPQFEAERKDVRKGVIKDKDLHKKIISSFIDYVLSVDLVPINLTYSPIKGPKGNIEFLLHIKPTGVSIDKKRIDEVVDEAYRVL